MFCKGVSDGRVDMIASFPAVSSIGPWANVTRKDTGILHHLTQLARSQPDAASAAENNLTRASTSGDDDHGVGLQVAVLRAYICSSKMYRLQVLISSSYFHV